jgi:hypothetical protein
MILSVSVSHNKPANQQTGWKYGSQFSKVMLLSKNLKNECSILILLAGLIKRYISVKYFTGLLLTETVKQMVLCSSYGFIPF